MLKVTERGQFVATMRHIHVWLMETLAAWVPTTPEMEVKLLFGEHIWDAAQHADALGKRTFELRMPLQHSLRPNDAYVGFLSDLGRSGLAAQRLAAIYDVLLPALTKRFQYYLNQTDSLSDAPTVRILERELADIVRMCESAQLLRQELPQLALADEQWASDLRAREAAIETVVGSAATTPAVA